MKWKDAQDVLLLSTSYGPEMVPAPARRHRSGKEPKLKPRAVKEYNKGKTGIDMSDQLLPLAENFFELE